MTLVPESGDWKERGGGKFVGTALVSFAGNLSLVYEFSFEILTSSAVSRDK